MKITKNSVVELDYQLMDLEGKVWESSDEGGPWVYLQGHGELMPGLEGAIEGKGTGQKVNIELKAEEAYGKYDDDLRTEVPLEAFAEVKGLTEGMRLAAEGSDGVHAVLVREIRDDVVVIDANHPLAGQDVKVSVKILSVRAASDDEISHGHVHAAGSSCGHSH